MMYCVIHADSGICFDEAGDEPFICLSLERTQQFLEYMQKQNPKDDYKIYDLVPHA